MKALSDYLKKVFPVIKDRKKLIVIFLILVIFGITYSRYLKALFFLAIFIAAGGASKFYHRLFKTSVGIDLVFFTTIMISLVYKNLFFSLLNAWLGLIIADNFGQKLSYTSIVSLVGLSIIAIAAKFMPFSFLISAIVLTIIFEIYSVISYNLLGSSLDKIAVYFATHFAFNIFLILSFAESLSKIMV